MACLVLPSGTSGNGDLWLRDAFGIKLIYYRIDGDRLYFGSEMRAVRAMPAGQIDPTSLNPFLRYR
jgi:asparagine synthetase B (glutamine-hydrolysing)